METKSLWRQELLHNEKKFPVALKAKAYGLENGGVYYGK